jgi:hypothetical protein
MIKASIRVHKQHPTLRQPALHGSNLSSREVERASLMLRRSGLRCHFSAARISAAARCPVSTAPLR